METDTKPVAPAILAFLFTDLEGSTRLWQQFPEAMKIALARHDDLLREAVQGANGHVVKTTGDGFHAVFASAHDALDACLQAQQSLQQEPWGETGPLRVRMGLHAGEAQQRGGDYYGTSVNRAARLMAAAHGGQVLLTAAVAAIIADRLPAGASLRDLGEHRLKDLQRPQRVFQLLHPDLPGDFPPIASLNRRPTNLPSQPTAFVGREEQLGDVKKLLAGGSVRLLTLLGPGGTGKTRLALQTGAELVDRFDDGAFFVDLAPIRDPQAVLPAISRTIGLSESSERPMLDHLQSQLGDSEMLLLLDNFEQVTAAAVHVAQLLQACPRLKLLATSREALHVRGEHLYPVPPLGLPTVNGKRPHVDELAHYEAVQLFVERARAVRPGFELTEENAPAVADLCLRLDGLPLAIELAAARLRLFTPQALQQRLGNRLNLLRGGARDLPERQQTLQNTIDWSYELLQPGEKALFAVVSVFSGCTLEALEAVAGNIEQLQAYDLDAVEGILSLADKSLVRLVDDAPEPRLRMLETIREYATEQLHAVPGLHADACRQHAVHFANFARQQWRLMAGQERDRALNALEADVDNLKIAWRYWVQRGDLLQLQEMVDALWLLFDARGWYQATVELTTDLLDMLSATPDSPEQAKQEIMLQTSLARALMAVRGYTPEVEEAYKRALALSEKHGQIPQLFPVLRGLSSYYMYRAEFDKGAEIGRKILDLARQQDDDTLRVHGYLVLGANTGFLEGFRAGLELLDKGIALFEREAQTVSAFQLGNYPGVVCYTTSAFLLWWLGYPDRALQRAQRAMEAAQRLNHPYTLAYALYHTGVFHLWRGELEPAHQRAQRMCDVAQENGFQIWVSLADILLGAVQAAMGHADLGLDRVERGFVAYQNLKSPPVFLPEITAIRTAAYAHTQRYAEAETLLDAHLRDAPEEHVLQQTPELLLLKADLLLTKGPQNRAAAADLLRTIITASLQMEGRTMALRAAVMLCRLQMEDGVATEDARTLSGIYDSFTEGFDTPDLQEARALLERLGQSTSGS